MSDSIVSRTAVWPIHPDPPEAAFGRLFSTPTLAAAEMREEDFTSEAFRLLISTNITDSTQIRNLKMPIPPVKLSRGGEDR